MAVGGIDDEHIDPRLDQRPRPEEKVARRPHRRGDTEAPMPILVRIRILPALVDVLHGDEPLERTVGCDDRELLDAMLTKDSLGFLERRARSAP